MSISVFLLIWISRRTARFVDGLYTYQGSDAPEASSDGRPGENSFYDNTISNTETGVKIKEADNTIITGETGSKRMKYELSHPTCISPFFRAA